MFILNSYVFSVPSVVLTPHNITSSTLTNGWFEITHGGISQRIKADSYYGTRYPWHVLDGTYTWAQMTVAPERIGWMTNATSTGILTYDLGQTRSITKVTFWNYGEGTQRRVLTYTVHTSTDDVSYTQVASGSCAQIKDLRVDITVAASNARYVRLTIGNVANTEGYVGINEFEIAGISE